MPWAARRLGRPVKWTEDRREHFSSTAQERGQSHDVRVGSTPRADPRHRGGVRARPRGLHPIRHDGADHHEHPVGRGRTGPAPTVSEFTLPLHQHALIVTPYRGAGRPQALASRRERVMDEIAARARASNRTVVRDATSCDRRRCPYDVRASPSRTAGPVGLRQRSDFPAASVWLRRSSTGTGPTAFRRAGDRAPHRPRFRASASPLRRGHRHRAVRGRARADRDRRPGRSSPPAVTSQGQGHHTSLRRSWPAELGCEPSDVDPVITGDTDASSRPWGRTPRRSAVTGGSAVAVTAHGVREKVAGDRGAGAPQVDPEDLEIRDGGYA